MTPFDLLFLVAVLAAVVTLVVAAYQAIRGRAARAGTILLRLAVSAAFYLGIVALVSLLSPRRVLHVGDPRCFDDWCFAVEHVQHAPGPQGVVYQIDLRLFSEAKRISQRENGVAVYLTDSSGRRFDPDPAPTAPPWNVLLGPGESVTTTRVFHLPAAASDVGLILEHGGFNPGVVVIGDDSSLLHKRTVVRFD